MGLVALVINILMYFILALVINILIYFIVTLVINILIYFIVTLVINISIYFIVLQLMAFYAIWNLLFNKAISHWTALFIIITYKHCLESQVCTQLHS